MVEKNPDEILPPWLLGIIDTLVGARFIQQSKIPHRNRLAVILLDSAFETACRAFLRYRARIKLQDAHKSRDGLMKTVQARLPGIGSSVWESIEFYYQEIRCDLYHESAGKTVTDEALLDYQRTVEFIIDRAFHIRSTLVTETRMQALSHSTHDRPKAPVKQNRALPVSFREDKAQEVLGLCSENPALTHHQIFTQYQTRLHALGISRATYYRLLSTHPCAHKRQREAQRAAVLPGSSLAKVSTS